MGSIGPTTHDNDGTQEPISIAIVGGGIVGMILALGLMRRNIHVHIYEQGRNVREIGAGLAFTANAVNCMNLLNPQIKQALRSVATSNGDPENPNDYLQWVDGYHKNSETDPLDEKFLFKLYAGVRGFEGCHRAHLLEELTKVIPADVLSFRKRLETVDESAETGRFTLSFNDGITAEADAGKNPSLNSFLLRHKREQYLLFPLAIVIGCDGIKSRVRQLILGQDNPASYATYTHKVAYRALIPMDKAIASVGLNKAKNQHMHIGPKSHLLHFPVANQTLVNVVAFDTDPHPWTNSEKLVIPATREEVQNVFKSWGATVRAIVDLFPENLDKWAVFDSAENPAPYFSQGRICLAGDAAHAAAPHHGAGAGSGVEDALCLATALETATSALHSNAKLTKADAIAAAFETYNAVRRDRAIWLVNSSRQVAEIYEWNHVETGEDADKCFAEIKARSHKIWYFDYQGMVMDTIGGVEAKLGL